MAWIESHQTLKEHPKTYALAEALCVDKAKAVGHLHLLWWWCVDYAPTGVLKGFSDSQIARAAEWSGDSKVFVEALVGARFIDRQDGALKVHDWEEFRLHYELALERKERQRDQVRVRVEAFRGRKRTCNEHVTQSNAANIPNQTIPNLTKPDKQSNGAFAPPTLDQVRAYCKERKNSVDPRRFNDFYASKGWMVGKNKMKDWQAAVRTWERSEPQKPGPVYPDFRPLTKDEMEAGYEALEKLPKPKWLK